MPLKPKSESLDSNAKVKHGAAQADGISEMKGRALNILYDVREADAAEELAGWWNQIAVTLCSRSVAESAAKLARR